jgi:hypothetical protein
MSKHKNYKETIAALDKLISNASKLEKDINALVKKNQSRQGSHIIQASRKCASLVSTLITQRDVLPENEEEW